MLLLPLWQLPNVLVVIRPFKLFSLLSFFDRLKLENKENAVNLHDDNRLLSVLI